MGSNLGTNLTGIDFVFLVVPISLVLAGWVFVVLWADAHPDVRHSGGERRQVTGGSRLPGTGSEAGPVHGGGAAEPVMATGAADESTAAEARASQSAAAAADQRSAREGQGSG